MQEELLATMVILAAGTYMSPAILQRSGVGPRDELARLGLALVAELPGVGANLLDHPMVYAAFEGGASLGTSAPDLQDVMLKTRSSRCRDDHWDTHILVFVDALDDRDTFQIDLAVAAVAADSTGHIRLMSSKPDVLPELTQPFVALSDRDVAVLIEGIQVARRLVTTPALGSSVGKELEPGPDERDIETWVRENCEGYWHPVGTCRMGPQSDGLAVVDPTGRVHGTQGLLVADASIFPTTPRANTNLPTIGIAEYIASTIR